MPPMIDQAKCRACGLCMQICPLDVFTKREEKIVVAYPEECWHCRACVIDCPAQAISMRYPLSHMMLHIDLEH